jgi:adenylate kinase
LDAILLHLGLSLDRVLYMEAPVERLTDRLAYRTTCAQCGAKYNLKLQPPQTEGVCDRCENRHFTQRADDQPDVIGARLQAYRQETEPLVAWYDAKHLLTRLDADQSVDMVFADVERIVSPLFEASYLPLSQRGREESPDVMRA